MAAPEGTSPKLLPTGVSRVSTTSSTAASPRAGFYLVQGDPGAGKTTLALQFLLAGVAPASAPSTSASPRRARSSTRSPRRTAGRSTASRSSRSVEPTSAQDDAETTLYQPSEVELGERMRAHPARRSTGCGPTRDRARLLLGAAAARAERAPVPAADPRAEAAARERASCTILLIDNPQPGAPDMLLAEPRPRRRHDGAARPAVRRRAAPAAGR